MAMVLSNFPLYNQPWDRISFNTGIVKGIIQSPKVAMVFDHGFYIGTFRDIAFNKSFRVCKTLHSFGLSCQSTITILLLFCEANAVALPIPEDPPVIATLFLNAVSIILFFYRTVFFFRLPNIFNSFDKGIGIK
jgi:hypothetical protein